MSSIAGEDQINSPDNDATWKVGVQNPLQRAKDAESEDQSLMSQSGAEDLDTPATSASSSADSEKAGEQKDEQTEITESDQPQNTAGPTSDLSVPNPKDVSDGVGSVGDTVVVEQLATGFDIQVDPCSMAESKSLKALDICRLRKIVTSGPTTLEFSPDRSQPAAEIPPSPKPESVSAKDEPVDDEEPGSISYHLDPMYVLQLTDYSGDVVKEKVDVVPTIVSTPPPSSHVLELVTTITFTGIRSYSTDEEKEAAMKNGTVSGVPTLRILSPLLIDALNAVVSYYPEQTLEREVNLVHPYKMLVHYKKDLEQYKSEQPSCHPVEEVEERNRHIDSVLKFVQSKVGDSINAEEFRHQKSVPAATFQYYWMLLRPGEFVYATTDGIINPYVIKQVKGGAVDEDKPRTPYLIHLWNVSYDGRSLGRCTKVVYLQPFDGERAINSMPVYPIRFQVDKPGETPMWDRMIQRGKRYVDASKQLYCDYKGQTLTHPKRAYQGRVMIDTAMFPWDEPDAKDISAWEPVLDGSSDDIVAARGKGCTCKYCLAVPPVEGRKPTLADYDNISTDQKLFDEQYFLCSYYVFGYVFSSRKWELLDVECICNLKYDRDFIDKLVITPENKHIIKAICRNYTREKAGEEPSGVYSADFIQGKGEGQILLLHGKPGVGKTLTAECVAEYTQRPLLALTPGDIGTDPVIVEQNLTRYFKLGESWGAILLLDEADVYLESRNLKDLVRNSLVSVFLRRLEYYQGILFLTTNRVGTFDEAFASRIHVHLHYGDLQKDGRNQIWENLFDKLEDDRPEVWVDYNAKQYVNEDKTLQELNWNGRQIRNAFSTAVSLAEYDASEIPPTQTCKHCTGIGHISENCGTKYKDKAGKKVFLRQKHFDSVTKMSQRFQDYLTSVRGGEASKEAKIYHLRDDDFGNARI